MECYSECYKNTLFMFLYFFLGQICCNKILLVLDSCRCLKDLVFWLNPLNYVKILVHILRIILLLTKAILILKMESNFVPIQSAPHFSHPFLSSHLTYRPLNFSVSLINFIYDISIYSLFFNSLEYCLSHFSCWLKV